MRTTRAFVIACLLAAAQTAWSAEPSFYVSWGSPPDGPVKDGQSSGASIAWALGNQVAIDLSKSFPCAPTTTSSDVRAQMDLQRMKELLGANIDPQTLANIGGAIGATTVVFIQVTRSGDNVTVTGVAVNSATVKTVARNTITVPNDNNVLGKLDAFSRQFTASLAAQLPRCPGKDWTGSVGINYTVNLSSKDGVSNSGGGSLDCSLPGDGGPATCTLSGGSEMKGPKGSVTFAKSAKDAKVTVGVGVSGGKLKITIGAMTVESKISSSDIGTVTSEENLNAQSFEVPASNSETHQSGTFTESVPGGGMTITYKWGLTRQPQKKK